MPCTCMPLPKAVRRTKEGRPKHGVPRVFPEERGSLPPAKKSRFRPLPRPAVEREQRETGGSPDARQYHNIDCQATWPPPPFCRGLSSCFRCKDQTHGCLSFPLRTPQSVCRTRIADGGYDIRRPVKASPCDQLAIGLVRRPAR